MIARLYGGTDKIAGSSVRACPGVFPGIQVSVATGVNEQRMTVYVDTPEMAKVIAECFDLAARRLEEGYGR